MLVVDGVTAARHQALRWREEGAKTALVPTMGNLHEGHLALVKMAKTLADKVIVTIFVNPVQFGPNEDFDSYPRTLEADLAKLAAEGVDLVFTPAAEAIYPEHSLQVVMDLPSLTGELCGQSRPSHFSGVMLIISKLFNIFSPDYAVFGEKDFQQLAVIRGLVQALCFPVEIIGHPIVRDSDGLAMSSRNQYLTPEQRIKAPELYTSLRWAAKTLTVQPDVQAVIREAGGQLKSAGFCLEYLEILDAVTLKQATDKSSHLVIAVAAKLGKTRLIDNIVVNVTV